MKQNKKIAIFKPENGWLTAEPWRSNLKLREVDKIISETPRRAPWRFDKEGERQLGSKILRTSELDSWALFFNRVFEEEEEDEDEEDEDREEQS